MLIENIFVIAIDLPERRSRVKMMLWSEVLHIVCSCNDRELIHPHIYSSSPLLRVREPLDSDTKAYFILQPKVPIRECNIARQSLGNPVKCPVVTQPYFQSHNARKRLFTPPDTITVPKYRSELADCGTLRGRHKRPKFNSHEHCSPILELRSSRGFTNPSISTSVSIHTDTSTVTEQAAQNATSIRTL